jgi:N utilization substance protein B
MRTVNTVSNTKVKPLSALRRKARHYAVQALYQWHMSGLPINQIEAQFRSDYDMKDVDIEYFHEIIHKVPSNLSTLDEAMAPLMDRAIGEVGPVELAVLRLSMYELAHRIDVPFKVVINEAVSLAKKFGATDSHKFVNGVLDKAAKTERMIEVKASNI